MWPHLIHEAPRRARTSDRTSHNSHVAMLSPTVRMLLFLQSMNDVRSRRSKYGSRHHPEEGC